MRVGGWGRAVRVLGVVVLLSVAWLQLALPPLPHDPQAALGGSGRETPEFDPSLGFHRSPASKFLQNKAQHQSSSQRIELSLEQILEIREQIQLRSGNETVLNEELFGPIQPDTIVIAVQVHNRLEYLRHLIVSLAQARDIDSVLLVFSHDYFDEDINQLITTIDFCKVMQIFYPHSLQTHPHSFPGESQGDCPRDTKPEEAAKVKCVGTPDLYKHYREARFTQTKHHWWWKANNGVHHKKKDCSSRTVLNKVHRALQTGQRTLFPRQLIVVHTPPKKVKNHKGNGGWGDKRDHALCRSFSVSTSPEHSMVNNSILSNLPIMNNSSVNGSVARSVS